MMNHRLLLFILLLSCNPESVSIKQVNEFKKFNSYRVFDEPSSKEINEMDFYLLIASWGSSEDGYILSVRKAKGERCSVRYKEVRNYFFPPIAHAIESDTLPFKYSSIYYNIDDGVVDSLEKLVGAYEVRTLKDTLLSVHLGGRTREVIIKINDSTFNVFRSYGDEKSVEKKFLEFIENCTAILKPEEPAPFFKE